MTLAIVTTAIQKLARSLAEKIKLGILNTLLWGGTILLAFEHVWHGEVVPWPPFLTAMSNSADIPIMLHEMATAGVAMATVTSLSWVSMLAIIRVMPTIVAVKEIKPVKVGIQTK